MGHAVEYYHYPVGTDKSRIEAEMNEEAIYNSDSRSGLGVPINFMQKTFDSEEEAEQYLEKYCKGKWYPEVAVQYKYIPQTEMTKTKAYMEKEAKLSELNRKYWDEEHAFFFKDHSSQYIGCKNCGSKLSREHLRSNHCPLCNNDLRSDTFQKNHARLRERIRELENQIRTLNKDLMKKQAKKVQKNWLVRIEYHV